MAESLQVVVELAAIFLLAQADEAWQISMSGHTCGEIALHLSS